MQGVRLAKNELLATYAISQRLAVRVGALLARKTDVTAAVLEMAAPGSAVERTLLAPDVLAQAQRLDSEALQRAAAEAGIPDPTAFVVTRTGEWRTIALAEESLAEEGWRAAPSAEKDEALSLTASTGQGLAVRPNEVARAFSPDTIARLKLQALSGADPAAQASALRQIRLAPLPPQEKGSLFLYALLDPISPARGEAVKGLEDLGFDCAAAEAIQDMLERRGPAQAAAIERIGALLGRLGEAESQVALRVLIEGLREFTDPQVQSPLVRVLCSAVEVIARRREIMEESARLCLRKAAELSGASADRVRHFLFLLAGRDPEGLEALLWDELDALRQPGPRALVLTLLAQVQLDAKARAKLAGAMVQEILRNDVDEMDRQKLGHNLASLGETAFEPILRRSMASGPDDRARLAPLLDMLVVDHAKDAALRNRAAHHFVESLRLATPRLRAVLYQSRVFGQSGLDARVKKDAARAIIASLRPTDHPDMLDRAAALLENLGAEAVAPMMDALRQGAKAAPAGLLARALARAAATQSGGPAASALATALRKRVQDPATTESGFAIALATLTASGAQGAEQAREDAGLLLSRLGAVPYHAGLIEALGVAAAGAAVDLPYRLAVVQRLSAIVESPRNDDESLAIRKIETPDGPLFEFSGQVAFDTEALPATIEALERVYNSLSVTPALKTRIFNLLAQTWEKVASWQTVWGPQSSERLALALARMAARPETPAPACLGVARSMSRQINRLSVVRALGILCAWPLQDETFDRIATETGAAMLDFWDQPETAPEERIVALETAARIVSRPGLAARGQAARRLAQRTASLLFEALASGAACRPFLEWMAAAEGLPRKLRSDIEAQLPQAVALEKAQEP